MKPAACVAALSPLACAAAASRRAPAEEPANYLADRGLIGGVVDGVVGLVKGLPASLSSALDSALATGDTGGAVDVLRTISPQATPATVQGAASVVESIVNSSLSSLFEYNALLLLNGIVSNVDGVFDLVHGTLTGKGGSNNVNPDAPTAVYPQLSSCDAPYTVDEAKLRAAIYIPETFTYGEKPPVILFPGTGNVGFLTFVGNFIPLLRSASWADPVWINVPGFLLDDVQLNAEYAAYAINYISALTGSGNVSVVAWSQGNIAAQWAYKYWPSARAVTSDHIALSADYAGTTAALELSSKLSGIPLDDPAVLQQGNCSAFIHALRSAGGDSAFVPTTSIYSGNGDSVVEPQTGTGASAYLLDAWGVGATNVEVQVACADRLAGGTYSHAGLMAHPLAFALARDALTHDGPADLDRLDLDAVCGRLIAPGLGLDDFQLTEQASLIALLAIVAYPDKVAEEPAVKEYALAETPAICTV